MDKYAWDKYIAAAKHKFNSHIDDREEILSTMSTRECIMSAPVLLLVHGDHYHFKANTVDVPYVMRVDDTVNNKALSLANDEFISSSESL